MIADARRPIGFDRVHNRPDGLPKRAWPTREAARRYARQVLGLACVQYACPVCLRFHNSEKAR